MTELSKKIATRANGEIDGKSFLCMFANGQIDGKFFLCENFI